MRRMIIAIILPAVLAVTLLASGCQEKDLSAQERKAKLKASSNIDLKRQLNASNKEIAKQTELLADCKKQRLDSIEKLETEIARLNKVLSDCKRDAARLKSENTGQARLLAKCKKGHEKVIAKLKAEVAKLKQDPGKYFTAEMEKEIKASAEATGNLLKMFAEAQTELTKLQTENIKLKKQIKDKAL